MKLVDQSARAFRLFCQGDAGRDVTYIAVPERGHCDLPNVVREDYERRICASVKA